MNEYIIIVKINYIHTVLFLKNDGVKYFWFLVFNNLYSIKLLISILKSKVDIITKKMYV